MARKKSKRASLKPGSSRLKTKLDTVFACPTCSNDKTVGCKMYPEWPNPIHCAYPFLPFFLIML